jgi:hypothetical protein
MARVQPDACLPRTCSSQQCTLHAGVAGTPTLTVPIVAAEPRLVVKCLWRAPRRELSWSQMAAALELPEPSPPSPPLSTARTIAEAAPLPFRLSPRAFQVRATTSVESRESAADDDREAFSFAEPASFFSSPPKDAAGAMPQ